MNLAALARQIGILLAFTVLAGAATKAFHPKAPDWKLVSDVEADPNQLGWDKIQEQFGGDVLWIDSRATDKFDAGHVPGALNISQAQFQDQLFAHFDTLATTEKPIVVYCDGSSCELSKKVAQELRESGLGQVYYMAGGWEELRNHF